MSDYSDDHIEDGDDWNRDNNEASPRPEGFLTDEEIIALEDLKQARTEFMVELFQVDKDDARKLKKNPFVVFKFNRNLFSDTVIRHAYIDDDMAIIGAIYARYNQMHALAHSYLAKVDREIIVCRARLYRQIREELTKDPNRTEKITSEWINAIMEDAPSLMMLYEIRISLEKAVMELRGACSAIYMKRDGLQAIARGIQSEQRLTGGINTYRDENDKRSSPPTAFKKLSLDDIRKNRQSREVE